MKHTLTAHQEEGVKALLKNKRFILADDMGVGKTIQAIRAMDFIKNNSQFNSVHPVLKVLIVCPSGLVAQWKKQIETQSVQQEPWIFSKSIKSVKDIKEITILSYGVAANLAWLLRSIRWDVLICDEAHFLKTLSSQRSQAILGAPPMGIAHSAKRVWFLTGTPVENRPIELYPILSSMFPQVLGEYVDYEKYAMYFCGGFFKEGQLIALGATNLEELKQRISPIMLRRTIKETEQDLPNLKVKVVYLRSTPQITSIIEKGMAKASRYKNVHGQLNAMRRDLAVSKIPQVIKFIDSLIASGEKIVVFYHHKAVGEKLIENYPMGVRYDGELSKVQKTMVIDVFKENTDCKILFASITSANAGIDGLQKASSTIVFVESDWGRGVIKQAIARLYRKGQDQAVGAYLLLVRDSIEARMLKSFKTKTKTVQKLGLS